LAWSNGKVPYSYMCRIHISHLQLPLPFSSFPPPPTVTLPLTTCLIPDFHCLRVFWL
jgi:hypothetical protein